MKILKASAGSGKTYRLTLVYITLLLQNPDRYAYRHILAVTFTNKATAEMKSRILSELSILSKDPEKSGYYGNFVPSLFPNAQKLSERATDVLVCILHDYSAFAVSTIDRFFQQTLKAFSREIGYFASYQVELDKDSLLQESVDRMLDSLTENDREMLEWLDEDISSTLDKGDRVNLSSSLQKQARYLKSEEHGTKLREYGLSDEQMFSRERLRRIIRECNSYRKVFETLVRSAAKKVLDTLAGCGLTPADTNYKFLEAVEKYAQPAGSGDGFKILTDAFLKRASDKSQWFTKTKTPKLLPLVDGILDAPLEAFCSLFKDPYRTYRTAILLKDKIFSLGIAGEFFRNFDELVKEKNVLSIDDSNEILRKIIGGSDAPFVYEKLGVRYEHFLLDEFQDTSLIQWENFLPLLRESEANRHENLVVGDVKQSIYRFRGSDWKLLGGKLEEQFPLSETEVLDSNYRSTSAVVGFNNSFFAFASSALAGDITGQYGDVVQKTGGRDPQQGFVKVNFTDSAESELELVLDSVRQALSAGAQLGDIVVLVRNNGEGSLVANYLIDNGISVISDDSLDVRTSLVVRRLVSLLSWINNPEDRIGGYLASCLIPEDRKEEWKLQWHSLTDLCEAFLRLMEQNSPGCMEGQVLFIQSFMDCLQEWTASNGQNLQEFLDFFGGKELQISSPEDKASVRVMTIHKSKGLEFPYVILPFAEKVSWSKTSVHWCHLDGNIPVPQGEGPALPSAANAIYPLNLSSSLSQTLFSQDYENDLWQRKMDSINIFYVALTRPSKALHIISKLPSNNILDNPSCTSFSDASQILYQFLRGSLDADSSCTFGTPYDFSLMKRKGGSESTCEASYPSCPLDGRLRFSSDAADFFGSDGLAGAASSQRLNGIVLHDILSAVREPEDLRAAVDEAVRTGRFQREEAERDYVMLSSRVASAVSRGWFPANGKVITETDIIDSDGQVYRPDRVVITDGGVIVVDYKFGSHRASYETQVARYVQLYRRMGYSRVRGCLWYVYTDEVTEVECLL